ncbi:MAG: non-hydrolyzing UDP-N-acetylglucosamine 2-epimerase [bacterium]
MFGTRPEAIKMAPVIMELNRFRNRFKSVVAVTAQHRQMLDRVLEIFGIRPDYDLGIMRENQSLTDVTVRVLRRLEPVLKKENPDLVMVQGDATSAFAAALAAYYRQILIGHIEAGLRTFDKYTPFPEEVNRRFITTIADFHFAPTRWARQNLLREGIDPRRVYLTGNTVIDALFWVRRKEFKKLRDEVKERSVKRKVLLLTLHRRESFGKPLQGICQAILSLIERNPDVEVVYPVHPNPNVWLPVKSTLGGRERIHLVSPLDYPELVQLLGRAYLVLTDSGGITEEAPALGKPVLILRAKTERPEAIAAGVARLVGFQPEKIVSETEKLLYSKDSYRRMQKGRSPYGDGKAAKRIRKVLMEILPQVDK